MSNLLYASFANSGDAEKAIGALLDHGALEPDISVVVNRAGTADDPNVDPRAAATKGISTTTASDAGVTAAEGAGIGLGAGLLAGLATIFIPGFGLVIGGGALATALGAAVATGAAGAVVGGVSGYFEDQGVPADRAARFDQTIRDGGAVLALSLPSGTLSESEAEALLQKYNAERFENRALTV